MFRVLVLLAAHNGEKWICEQVESILCQIDVEIGILCSVDLSTDSTLDLLSQFPQVTTLQYGSRYGCAGSNFYRLLKEAKFDGYDYIALSDQDDIWLSDKIISAIKEMSKESSQAFSSNVTAFWEDGRRKEIVKSNPQTPYDHFFESPGPGCSFVLESGLASEIQDFITGKDASELIELHDWLLYAYAKCHGYKWTISKNSRILYRQHSSNQCGANSGLPALRKRYRIMRTGWYSNEVIKLFSLFGQSNSIVKRLKRKNMLDSFVLTTKCYKFRRKKREKLLLSLAMMLRLF